LGRFLSADTIVPDGKNPQAFNRYAYTLNNPVKYIDPSGHMVDDLSDGIGLGGVFRAYYESHHDPVRLLNEATDFFYQNPHYQIAESSLPQPSDKFDAANAQTNIGSSGLHQVRTFEMGRADVEDLQTTLGWWSAERAKQSSNSGWASFGFGTAGGALGQSVKSAADFFAKHVLAGTVASIGSWALASASAIAAIDSKLKSDDSTTLNHLAAWLGEYPLKTQADTFNFQFSRTDGKTTLTCLSCDGQPNWSDWSAYTTDQLLFSGATGK
jgi:hypothetical protein